MSLSFLLINIFFTFYLSRFSFYSNYLFSDGSCPTRNKNSQQSVMSWHKSRWSLKVLNIQVSDVLCHKLILIYIKSLLHKLPQSYIQELVLCYKPILIIYTARNLLKVICLSSIIILMSANQWDKLTSTVNISFPPKKYMWPPPHRFSERQLNVPIKIKKNSYKAAKALGLQCLNFMM